MKYNQDKVDEMTLALLFLVTTEGTKDQDDFHSGDGGGL